MVKETEGHETSTAVTEGTSLEESSVEHSSRIQAHVFSIEIRDVPSAAVCGEEFTIRVEARSAGGFSLPGREIEIYDHQARRVAAATLSEAHALDAGDLAYAEVKLLAPRAEGRYRWTVILHGADTDSLHGQAPSTFAFAAARKAEHLLTIEVSDMHAKCPAKNARVLLRPHDYQGLAYTSQTNEAGVALIHVPTGEYQLYVAGDQHERLVPTVQVHSDLTIREELTDRLNSWRVLPW